jgi:Uma2 family endonuclease
MVTTKRRYAFRDLLTLPDDSPLYDVLGGELVMRNVPGIDHGLVLSELFGLLYAAQEAGCGYVLAATSAVALDFAARGADAQDVTHPDLFFVSTARASMLGERALEGAPDLVIEIMSPTTRAEHLPGGKLRQAYERYGVPCYWLADIEARALHQFTLAGDWYASGHYPAPVILRPGDTLSSPLFPTVSVPVERVFRHVGRRPRR